MIKEISLEKMCYKKDKLSASLCLIGLVLNVFYFITLYRHNGSFYTDYKMGLSVLYNLIFMLLVFLAQEGIKVYNRKYAIMMFIIGLLQIFRIYYYPLLALNNGALTKKIYTYITIYLILSCVFLSVGSIISFIKSTLLMNYKTKNGKKKIDLGNVVK